MLRYISLIIAICTTFPCMAAMTYWEAFDMKNCKHWALTPNDFQGQGDNYELAKEMAEEMNSSGKDVNWLVVQGVALYESDEDKYGVCSYQSSWTEISCAKGVDFPLSGATYRYINSKGNLNAYKCINGCEATDIQKFYDEGYETGSEGSNVEYRQLKAKFERKCHEEEKSEKWSKENNKRAAEDLNRRLTENAKKRELPGADSIILRGIIKQELNK